VADSNFQVIIFLAEIFSMHQKLFYDYNSLKYQEVVQDTILIVLQKNFKVKM
jgi:hypothetical protein